MYDLSCTFHEEILVFTIENTISSVQLLVLLFTGLLLICRSGLKHKANKQHEGEKDFMATLQYVGIDTSLYTTQSAVPDPQDCDEDGLADDCDDEPIQFYDGVNKII